MEDVQDGIKVSIQDGVEEDPELIERLDPKAKSSLGLLYIMLEFPNPQITTVFNTYVADNINVTVTTIVETSVV